MKIIKGDLILKKDTTFEESIKVEGNIKGYFDLKVIGNIVALNISARNINARNIDARNINARNINARNIDALDIVALNIDARNISARNIDALNIDARNINARNISAWNIVALNINARNINAWNIDAWNIICEKRIKKYEAAKTICRVFIQNKSDLEKKEQMGSEDKPKKDYNARYENQEMKGGKNETRINNNKRREKSL